MSAAIESDRQAAEQWLAAELNRMWLVAERCLRQFQRAQLRPQPDNPSLAEIEGIFTARRAARGGQSSGPMDEAELSRAITDVESSLYALRRAAPLGRMIENLGLSPLEVETLVVAMSPHIDAPLSDVFALLRGSPSRRGVDLSLVSQLYQLRRTDRLSLLDALDSERPLLAWRMIQVISPDSMEGYSSVNYRAIMPTFDVLSALCGRAELAPALAKTSKLIRGEKRLDDLVLDEQLQQKVERLCAMGEQAAQQQQLQHMPWVMFFGPKGIGKLELATRLAAYCGRPTLWFDPTAAEQGALDDLLRRAQREALLRGAVLYIGPLRGELLADNGRELVKRVLAYPSMLVLGIESVVPPRISVEHSLQEVQLSIPPEPARLTLWQRVIPESIRAEDVHLESIARAFHLAPGEIIDTGAEAQELASLSPTGTITHDQLRSGIDRRLRNDLGDMAKRISVSARWDDLVLPDEDILRIKEFIGRSKFAYRVYSDWGFGQRVGYGKGMIALFSGPPGTGKTMLAGLIAEALDLDVYQVDLAQVVSKWVGETEKQLAKVFDAAERAHAVLLFDEADSLFAKRTEVKTSNDRYGNLAVNYLLQRLEQYSGVVVMTTNKEASLDEALQRRLTLHLHLEVPEPSERERLWQSMLPPTAPWAKDINWKSLAKDYEISGGYIKNAVLRAAFLAAAANTPINMTLLRRSASLEMEDMGRLIARSGRAGVAGVPSLLGTSRREPSDGPGPA